MQLNDPLDLLSLKLFGFGFSVSIDTLRTVRGSILPVEAVLRWEITFAFYALRREWTLTKYE